MNAEQQVIEAALARAQALADGDARRLSALLHKDFTWTSHDGRTFSRQEYIHRNTQGTVVWRFQELGAAEVTIEGDTAVLRAEVTDVVGSDDGADEVFAMPMTQVWIRRDDTWVCLAGHAGPRQDTDARLVTADPTSDDAIPNPLSRTDAEALIGILAVLEGHLFGRPDDALFAHLTERVRDSPLMPGGIDERAALRIAISNLNQRVRYTFGEYAEMPKPDDGLADHHVRFATAESAARFVTTMEQLGMPARQMMTGRQEEPFHVMVTTGEPVLSPEFDRKEQQIAEAARHLGGHLEGWGGGAPES